MLVFAGVLGCFEQRLVLPATLSAKSAIPDNKNYQECYLSVVRQSWLRKGCLLRLQEVVDLHKPKRRDTGAQGMTVSRIIGLMESYGAT